VLSIKFLAPSSFLALPNQVLPLANLVYSILLFYIRVELYHVMFD